MKWKIFIVTHGPVINSYYANDTKFLHEYFVLFNVSNTPITHDQFQVINKSEIKDYIELGKWYAESEAIYNIYKNNLYQGYDYIGFIHWDYELRSEDPLIEYEVVNKIVHSISNNEPFISFSSFDFDYVYNQHIMMDDIFPNQCFGEGKNCFDTIIAEYNEYFSKAITIESMLQKEINLCSAFMCQKSIFEELMGFYCNIIEKGYLNNFDTNHQHRFQGVMMERYIGCYSEQFDFVHLPLYHHYDHKKEASNKQLQIEKIRKVLSQIKKKLLRK